MTLRLVGSRSSSCGNTRPHWSTGRRERTSRQRSPLILSGEYAVKIARDWNVPASQSGFVTGFEVRRSLSIVSRCTKRAVEHISNIGYPLKTSRRSMRQSWAKSRLSLVPLALARMESPLVALF
jgi:hypothetical protein